MTGFQHSIAGGQGSLIVNSFQSPDFISGVQGWQVTKNGDVEFNSGTFRGTVTGGEFKGNNFIINANGQFFYSGIPASGNLLISIAGSNTSDPFGTAVGQGISVIGSSGSQINIEDNGSEAIITLAGSGLTSSTNSAQIITEALQAGVANERSALAISSGKENNRDDAALQLFSQSADGTIAANAIIEFGGTVVLTVTKSEIDTSIDIIRDSWHSITLDIGWTVSGQAPQYRTLPDGNVQVRGSATHSGVTVDTSINSANPLTAAYRPNSTRFYRPPTAQDAAGTVQMGTDGVFTMRASGFTATQVIMDGIYSI